MVQQKGRLPCRWLAQIQSQALGMVPDPPGVISENSKVWQKKSKHKK